MSVASWKDREALLLNSLRAALESLGYRQDAEVPWGTADASWWFSRHRDVLTEAVAVRVRWTPKPFMVVDCVGSPFTLQELAVKGLEDNAAAFNLFNFQVLVEKRAPVDLLPQSILLDASPGTWPEFVRSLTQRVAFELDSVQPAIWNRIRRSLRDN